MQPTASTFYWHLNKLKVGGKLMLSILLIIKSGEKKKEHTAAQTKPDFVWDGEFESK